MKIFDFGLTDVFLDELEKIFDKSVRPKLSDGGCNNVRKTLDAGVAKPTVLRSRPISFDLAFSTAI